MLSLILELPVTAAFNPALRIKTLEYELSRAQLIIQSLQEQLRLQRIQFLGPRSETLSSLQLELLVEEEPGVTCDEVEAEANREPLKSIPPQERKRKPHPGRQRLPDHLLRVETVIPCATTLCTASSVAFFSVTAFCTLSHIAALVLPDVSSASKSVRLIE